MGETIRSGGVTDRHVMPGLPARRGFVALVVFLVSLALLGAGWMARGDLEEAIRPDSDDFVRAGEAMIYWMLTGGAGFEAMEAHPVFPHYFIPSVVLAGFYICFSEPVLKVVVLNTVLFSLIVVLMYRFWMSIHGPWSRWTGRQGFLLAGIGGFYVVFGLPDPFLLSYTVLTDIIFLFWASAFIVATASWLVEGGRRAWVIALVVALAAPYVRPTGILLPVLFLFALAANALIERHVSVRLLAAVSIGVPVVAAVVVVPAVVSMEINNPKLISGLIPDLLEKEFRQAVYYFKNGVAVSNRLETYVEAPSSYMDVLKMVLYRLGYYFIPLRLGEAPYTMVHNLVNLVYIVIVWPLTFIGVRFLARSGARCQTLALFLVLVSLSYGLLHSVTLLSFDWRYQLPAMVPLWMLAGVGLFRVLGYPSSPQAEAGSRRWSGGTKRGKGPPGGAPIEGDQPLG